MLRNPRQQSGQEQICSIYESINKLKRKCNNITVVWLPMDEDEELWTCAKEKAKEATRQGTKPQIPVPRIGKLSKKVDIALPGKHTRKLYDQLRQKEASVLAQLYE